MKQENNRKKVCSCSLFCYVVGICVLAYDFVHLHRLYDIRILQSHKSMWPNAKKVDELFTDLGTE